MFHKIVNIGRNSMKRKNFSVMAGKLATRLKERATEDVSEWYAKQAEQYEDFLQNLDADLWSETQEACSALTRDAKSKLETIPYDLGGGGNYELLYFLTRYMNPKNVVETGVAAGWSSSAVLTALEKNGQGMLYSSDFPYFRMKDPENYIGFVVANDLKSNWRLFIEGDQYNLPKICEEVEQIDLFHYDSDKSYEGRVRAFHEVSSKLSDNAAIIFDDIQDNAHFKDFVEERCVPYRVFGFGGKYLGLTGDFLEGL